MRIICERVQSRWAAWVEGRLETMVNARTPRGAIRRLAAEYPEIDLARIVPTRPETTPGRMVFVCGDVCPDCNGSGRYVGLIKVEDCARCQGSGYVDDNAFPF